MEKKRIKLLLSYDGSNYSGWQKQPSSLSIQEELEKRLTILLKEPIYVVGSSRTDAGVHAKGQVAHFDTSSSFTPRALFYSLNCLLPKDIKVLSLEEVENSFHARYSAKAKIYHYYLEFTPFSSPFSYKYSVPIYQEFSVELLKQAAKYFEGTHDFTSFANDANKGSCKKNPVRTIYHIEITPTSQGICLIFLGNGFLYKMIRNIMGVLLLAGKKKLPLEEIPKIFAAKDRRKAPAVAPAKGLFLKKIYYEPLKSSSERESHLNAESETSFPLI